MLEVTDVNADTYLSSCKDHNTYAYYINNIHRGSRSRVSLIQTSTSQLIPLAVNTANIFLLEDICTMLEMIKAALREAPASGSRYEKKILENRGMMSLLYQHKQQEQEVWIRKWEETKFPENPSHPENRINYEDPKAVLRVMEQIAANRNYLLKGGEPDLKRCAHQLLDDFKNGRTGRITLDDLPGQSVIIPETEE